MENVKHSEIIPDLEALRTALTESVMADLPALVQPKIREEVSSLLEDKDEDEKSKEDEDEKDKDKKKEEETDKDSESDDKKEKESDEEDGEKGDDEVSDDETEDDSAVVPLDDTDLGDLNLDHAMEEDGEDEDEDGEHKEEGESEEHHHEEDDYDEDDLDFEHHEDDELEVTDDDEEDDDMPKLLHDEDEEVEDDEDEEEEYAHPHRHHGLHESRRVVNLRRERPIRRAPRKEVVQESKLVKENAKLRSENQKLAKRYDTLCEEVAKSATFIKKHNQYVRRLFSGPFSNASEKTTRKILEQFDRAKTLGEAESLYNHLVSAAEKKRLQKIEKTYKLTESKKKKAPATIAENADLIRIKNAVNKNLESESGQPKADDRQILAEEFKTWRRLAGIPETDTNQK